METIRLNNGLSGTIVETFKYSIFTITKWKIYNNVFTYEIKKTNGGFLYPVESFTDFENFENDLDLMRYIEKTYF